MPDPHAGSRRSYVGGVRTDAKPQDPVPDGVPDPGHGPREDPGGEKNTTEHGVGL